jgi:hypothetical protein
MPAVAVLAGLLLIVSYSMSHSVVTVDGTDWVEPVLLWISICIAASLHCASTCVNWLRMQDLRMALDDQSFEKMGALMCDNSWKLLGELPMFLSQINVFRGHGLSDFHELALLLQLYGGSQWVRKTGK